MTLQLWKNYFFVLIFSLTCQYVNAQTQEWVTGHTTSNGTYVEGHYVTKLRKADRIIEKPFHEVTNPINSDGRGGFLIDRDGVTRRYIKRGCSFDSDRVRRRYITPHPDGSYQNGVKYSVRHNP